MKLLRIAIAGTLMAVAAFFFVQSDIYQRGKISSYIWISEHRILVSSEDNPPQERHFPHVKEVRSLSSTKFLSNGFYIRQSKISAFTTDSATLVSLDMQDKGSWRIEDGFLLTKVESIENTGLPDDVRPKAAEGEFLKNIYFNEMKRAKKISYISDKVMLLTGLNQQNEVMVAK